MATDIDTQELTELERDHYERIETANQEVARLLLEWSQLKGDASEAKKEYDQAVSELTYLIARGLLDNSKSYRSTRLKLATSLGGVSRTLRVPWDSPPRSSRSSKEQALQRSASWRTCRPGAGLTR